MSVRSTTMPVRSVSRMSKPKTAVSAMSTARHEATRRAGRGTRGAAGRRWHEERHDQKCPTSAAPSRAGGSSSTSPRCIDEVTAAWTCWPRGGGGRGGGGHRRGVDRIAPRIDRGAAARLLGAPPIELLRGRPRGCAPLLSTVPAGRAPATSSADGYTADFDAHAAAPRGRCRRLADRLTTAHTSSSSSSSETARLLQRKPTVADCERRGGICRRFCRAFALILLLRRGRPSRRLASSLELHVTQFR